MQYASFSSFIRTLLIIILMYYLIKFAFKLFAPYLFQKAVSKVNENFQKQQQNYYNQGNQNNNNSYTDKGFEENLKQNKVPKERKKVGEYIDFEEID